MKLKTKYNVKLFIKSKIQFFESKIGVAKADYNRRKTIKIYF